MLVRSGGHVGTHRWCRGRRAIGGASITVTKIRIGRWGARCCSIQSNGATTAGRVSAAAIFPRRSPNHATAHRNHLDLADGAIGGLLLFYNKRMYCGLGFSDTQLIRHRTGLDGPRRKPDGIGKRLLIRWENNRHIVTFWTSTDGALWSKFDTQMEVSGYHHNTAYDFLSLRPGLYASGQGSVRFRDFRYEAL